MEWTLRETPMGAREVLHVGARRDWWEIHGFISLNQNLPTVCRQMGWRVVWRECVWNLWGRVQYGNYNSRNRVQSSSSFWFIRQWNRFLLGISLTTPFFIKRWYLYRKEKESDSKRFKMKITTTKNYRVIEINSNKVVEGDVVIDKDLLQEIRDHLAWDGSDKLNPSSEILCDKLDSLYPFLNQSKWTNQSFFF